MRKLVSVLVLAFAFGATAVRADNGFFYVGAGATKDKLAGIVNAGTSFTDIDSTSWKVFAGLRPVSFFAVEADYMDLGSGTGTYVLPGVGTCAIGVPNCAVITARSDAKAFAGYVVGFLPIPLPFLDVFGKAGVSRWKLNGSALAGGALVPLSFSNTGAVFAWGVGSQVQVRNVGARLEYESFRIPSTNGANVVSLTMYLNLY